MKKIWGSFLGFFLLISTCGLAFGNTVEVYLENLGDLKISAFQIFFVEPHDDIGLPLETDWATYDMDFNFGWGNQAKKSFWSLESLIQTDDRGTPLDDGDDADFAKGIGGVTNFFNENLALNEGLLVTMSSDDTKFAVDLNDPKNGFFDFTPPNGAPIIDQLVFSETWDGDNQILTISAVPIPSTVLLLGSGLFGLVALRRKRS